MALTYNVKASAVTANITNAESVIVGPILLPAGAIAAGDAIRIAVDASFPANQSFTVSVRVGANGNVADAALYTNTNIVATATQYNDANGWAQTYPGLNTSMYPPIAPFVPANFPSIVSTPTKVKGEIVAVCTATGSNNASLIFVVKPDRSVLDQENLLALIDNGNGLPIGNGSFQSNVAKFITLTAALQGPSAFTAIALGNGDAQSPGASLKLNTAANANGAVQFSMIETL